MVGIWIHKGHSLVTIDLSPATEPTNYPSLIPMRMNAFSISSASAYTHSPFPNPHSSSSHPQQQVRYSILILIMHFVFRLITSPSLINRIISMLYFSVFCCIIGKFRISATANIARRTLHCLIWIREQGNVLYGSIHARCY
jgi:hypothetical protein